MNMRLTLQRGCLAAHMFGGTSAGDGIGAAARGARPKCRERRREFGAPAGGG